MCDVWALITIISMFVHRIMCNWGQKQNKTNGSTNDIPKSHKCGLMKM